VKTLVRLFACAAILISAQSLASAQPRRGFAITDLDVPTQVGHSVYRIDLDNPGATVEMGETGVPQELEGLFSIGNRLFGVAESPDGTGLGGPSILVDITAAAVNPGGVGTLIGETGVNFGTEAGGAWNHLSGIAYAIFSRDDAPAGTKLTIIDPLTGATTELSTTPDFHVDGLAVGGDGTLYATDARLTDALWRYNFSANTWEFIGPLDPTFTMDFNEDTGLGNYLVGSSGTELSMITEGDGPTRVGRLWRVNHVTGQATLVGELRLAGSGAEVPEDVEGFDIPFQLLAGE
jgi:hypothetical protein